MTGEIHKGGCACGAVRYRIDGPPLGAAHCHCAMCRKAAGTPFVTWAPVKTKNFSITKGNLIEFKSSQSGVRGFCGTCGTALTFWAARKPDYIDVTLASFDDPEALTPTHHIWTGSRISWAHMNRHLPDFPEWTPAEFWSALKDRT